MVVYFSTLISVISFYRAAIDKSNSFRLSSKSGLRLLDAVLEFPIVMFSWVIN